MTPARWRQIESLYHAVLDSGPAERAGLLAQADLEVRRAVEQMLAQPSDGAPLDRPAWDGTESAAAAQPEIGSHIGPYRIEARLGAGGMGSVYRATDTRLGRQVAIKIPRTSFDARFEREARSIAALNHPNICTVHDAGPNYLVMELVEGATLAERIGKGPLPPPEAMAIARQIAAALDAAHERGIVHRDLKPANIKIKPDGTVKVLDFGLARVTSAPHSPGEEDPTHTLAVTEPGVVLGTPSYMAPEQALGKLADKRADIWSFGVVLWEMLAGRRLFAGSSSPEILKAVLTQEPDWTRVPAGARPLLRRCLERDPKRRLRDIGDAVLTLEEPVAERAPSGRRWWMAAAAALLAGVLAGGWAVARLRSHAAAEHVLRFDLDPPPGSRFAMAINATGMALSPDGKYAAYVVAANGKTALWLRPLDEPAARRIEGTEGASLPFWSPDGKSIAFFVNDLLERVDVAGARPQTICNVGFAVGGSWGPDGRILYGGWGSGLFVVAASGGTPAPFTTLNEKRGESFHYWPQVLPGGNFSYFVRSSNPEYTGMYAASLAHPDKPVLVLRTEDNVLFAPASPNGTKGHLLWLREATLIAQPFDAAALQLSGEPHPIAEPVAGLGLHGQMEVAVSAGVVLYSASNPLKQLVWYDRGGKRAGLLGEPADIGQFQLSPDGRRLVMSRGNPRGSDLWLLDLDSGVSTRFTFLPGINITPVWSPDGRTILFATGSPFNIFRKDASGTTAEQRLTLSRNQQFPLDWSPDGRWVVYNEYSAKRNGLWILPMGGGSPRIYSPSGFDQDYGRLSPDGRWMAFQSAESGEPEIYIDRFPDARGKKRISTRGGMFAEWAAGGRELFYVSSDSMLMSTGIKMDGGTVQATAPRPVLPVFVQDGGVSPFLVSSDGTRILVAEPEKGVLPLKAIVNWSGLLNPR